MASMNQKNAGSSVSWLLGKPEQSVRLSADEGAVGEADDRLDLFNRRAGILMPSLRVLGPHNDTRPRERLMGTHVEKLRELEYPLFVHIKNVAVPESARSLNVALNQFVKALKR